MNAQALRREMNTQIDIDAPPDSVWSVLTAFKSYGEWNPAIIAVSGDVSVGSQDALGCDPLSGAIESTATTIPEIIREMLITPWCPETCRRLPHAAPRP